MEIDMIIMILLVSGVLVAAFGYRLYMLGLGLSGFAVGGLIGAMIGILSPDREIMVPLCILVVGIIGACLNRVLYKIIVFAQSFINAFLAVFVLVLIAQIKDSVNAIFRYGLSSDSLYQIFWGIDVDKALVWGLVAGLVFGILGIVMTRVALIISSSLLGGSICGLGIFLITLEGQIDVSKVLLTIVVVAGLGMIFQFRTTKKLQNHRQGSQGNVSSRAEKRERSFAKDGEQEDSSEDRKSENVKLENIKRAVLSVREYGRDRAKKLAVAVRAKDKDRQVLMGVGVLWICLRIALVIHNCVVFSDHIYIKSMLWGVLLGIIPGAIIILAEYYGKNLESHIVAFIVSMLQFGFFVRNIALYGKYIGIIGWLACLLGIVQIGIYYRIFFGMKKGFLPRMESEKIETVEEKNIDQRKLM